MSGDDSQVLGNVIKIDDERIRGHLDRIVRGTVEETLNALLDAEADRLVGAGRYERSDNRRQKQFNLRSHTLSTPSMETSITPPLIRTNTGNFSAHQGPLCLAVRGASTIS